MQLKTGPCVISMEWLMFTIFLMLYRKVISLQTLLGLTSPMTWVKGLSKNVIFSWEFVTQSKFVGFNH